jgi:hypothetical protein
MQRSIVMPTSYADTDTYQFTKVLQSPDGEDLWQTVDDLIFPAVHAGATRAVIAYGQEGLGKRAMMVADDGIIARAVRKVFALPGVVVTCSAFEILGSAVIDLLPESATAPCGASSRPLYIGFEVVNDVAFPTVDAALAVLRERVLQQAHLKVRVWLRRLHVTNRAVITAMLFCWAVQSGDGSMHHVVVALRAHGAVEDDVFSMYLADLAPLDTGGTGCATPKAARAIATQDLVRAAAKTCVLPCASVMLRLRTCSTTARVRTNGTTPCFRLELRSMQVESADASPLRRVLGGGSHDDTDAAVSPAGPRTLHSARFELG